MNFANINDIKQHLESLQRSGEESNIGVTSKNYFGKLVFNNFFLCLYAGRMALCEPRVAHDNLLFYKKIQLSINEIIREQEHAVSPGTDSRFAGFPWLKYFTYTNSKGQVKPSYMGEMIPINEVVSLIRDVYKVSRLKIFF